MDPSIEHLLLVSPVVDVPLPAWNASIGSDKLPIVLSRNVSIEGDPQLGDWPVLQLNFVKGTVRLTSGFALAFRFLVLDGGRLDNPSRAPGLDILQPTLPGGTATLILGPAAAAVHACFPQSYQKLNLFGLQRPAEFPGQQAIDVGVSQDGCVNRTDVPYRQRCWPAGRTLLVDFAAFGADSVGTRGATVPNNLLVRCFNYMALCRARVSEACMKTQGKEPYVCYLEAVNNMLSSSSASSSSSPSSSSSSSSPSSSLSSPSPSVVPAASGSSPAPVAMTDRQQRLVVALCVSLVGGCLIVAALVVVTVLQRRRRGARGAADAAASWKDVATAAAADADAATAAAADEGSGRPNSTPKHSALDNAEPAADRRRSDKFGDGAANRHDLTPAAAAAAANGSSDSYPECTEEALQRSDDGERLSLGMAAGRKARPASGGGRTDCCGGDDVPVTPYTPHRPSLTLGVELTGAALPGDNDGVGCFPRGMKAAYNGSGIRALSVYSTSSYTLIDGSVATAGDAAVGAVASTGAAAAAGAAATGAPAAAGADADAAATDAVSAGGGGGGGGGGGVEGLGGCQVVELLPVVLGQGAFGRVYEGMYGGQRVAVKVMASFHPGAVGDRFAKSLAQEVQVLGRCQHPNIVRLLAAALEPPKLCLVMELMETSLERVLHGGGSSQQLLPMAKVLHIAVAVAKALAYLHPTIVHRDLKPGNVLVDNNAGRDCPTVKISDFGLSRLRITAVPTETHDAGTPSYMAPECFDVTNTRITHQADMFSFGVLLWEMLSGERPWSGLPPVTVALMVSHHGARLPINRLPPERRPIILAKLLMACGDAEPTRRPAAAEVAKELAILRQNLLAPPLRPVAGARLLTKKV